MIIDCAHYQDGRRRDEGAMPLEEAAARCEQRSVPASFDPPARSGSLRFAPRFQDALP
jgi:hypothetical protein